MVDFIKLYPEVVNNWARAWSETERERPWAYKRVQDSMTISQMEGKLWLVSEMENLNLSCQNFLFAYHKLLLIQVNLLVLNLHTRCHLT